jgi:hypothetical protein
MRATSEDSLPDGIQDLLYLSQCAAGVVLLTDFMECISMMNNGIQSPEVDDISILAYEIDEFRGQYLIGK